MKIYKFLLTIPLMVRSELIIADEHQLQEDKQVEQSEKQNKFSEISLKQENFDSLNDYENAIAVQKEKISKFDNGKFKNRALKLLGSNLLLNETLINQEVISIDISELRTLLCLSKKVLLDISARLIDKSVNVEVNRKNKIYKNVIDLLISKIDDLLSSKILSINTTMDKFKKIDEDLNKIIDKLKHLVFQNHPLLLACKGIKYFLNFAIINIDANDFLIKNEDKIKSFYKEGVSTFGEAETMVPVDQFGRVKVGSKIKIKQEAGEKDRGAYNNSVVDLSASTKFNAGIADAKGTIGVTFGGETKALGMNASSMISNNADKVKKKIMNVPSELQIFNQKRTHILEESKELKRNIVDFEKLCRQYSGISDIKITFSYIDPKYNLEKSKIIGFSGEVGTSLKSFANILNFKINAKHNMAMYKRNNDIYNLIKNTNLLNIFRDVNYFKQIAILCNKYHIIKGVNNDSLDLAELNEKFLKFCEKHGNFSNFDNFLNTIEYYSEILQNMADYKNKKMMKQTRGIKSKIENQFKTNGRLDTLLTAYFIGNGYLVLAKTNIDKSRINRLKSAFEKIALLLDESRASVLKNKKQNQYCKVLETTLSVSLAEDFINLWINNVSGSPYIYDNGVELNIDLDVSKVNQIYDKIRNAKNSYKDVKDFLEEKEVIGNKGITCLNSVEKLLTDSKDIIIKKLENSSNKVIKDNGEVFKNIILSLRLIKQTLDKNDKSLAFSRPILQKISQLLTSADKIKSRVRFVFKIVKPSNKLEFIGVKVLNSIKNSFNLKTSTISDNLPIEASFDVGMKRFIDNGFTISNGKSMFLCIKNIIDYCFIKEADFGGSQISSKNIYEFIKQSFSKEYIDGLFANFKKGTFTNIIRSNLNNIITTIKENDNLKQNNLDIDKIVNLTEKKAGNLNEGEFIDMLASYGSLIFKCIAKPHNENIYNNFMKN